MVHIGTYLLHEVIKVTAQNDKGLPQYPNSHFSIVSPSTDALHHLYLDLFTSCLWRYFLLVRLFSNPYNSPKLQPPLNYSPAENVSSSNQAGLKSGAIAQRILLAPRGCVAVYDPSLYLSGRSPIISTPANWHWAPHPIHFALFSSIGGQSIVLDHNTFEL